MRSPYTITNFDRTKKTEAAQAVNRPMLTAVSQLPAKWPYYLVGGMVVVAVGVVGYTIIKNTRN
jgi:hypothetical protein